MDPVSSMILTVSVAYLIGSVPFALLLARRWGTEDLRRSGSGNLGAANVLRTSGLTAGLLVAILDIAKGAASVAIAKSLGGDSAPAAAGFAAVVGHVYPVWLGFRGGKGVATAAGVFGVLAPFAMLPALAVFALGVWTTRYISIGSVLASGVLPIVAFFQGSPAAVVGSAVAVASLIIFRHRSNIRRIRSGAERRFGAGRSTRRAMQGQGVTEDRR
jgi:glycerol-3-phosphate acyltransferase PlsY